MSPIVIILIVIFVVILALILIKFAINTQSYEPFYVANIGTMTESNPHWRDVVYNSKNMQLALMSVPVGESLGMEVHPDNDQFFRVEAGSGKLTVGSPNRESKTFNLVPESTVIVPKGLLHNVENTGNTPLKFYTIYSPPHHRPGTRDKTHRDEIAREK